MALFGRRKPGFSKEVTLRPEDISGEFSDKNDPAMVRNSSPKEEKAEWAAKADAVMSGEAEKSAEVAAATAAAAIGAEQEKPALDLAQQAAAEGRTVDIFEYIDSLPDVEDPFPPSEPDPEPEAVPERKPHEVLADYIRERTKAIQLTAKKSLAEEEPELDKLLEDMHQAEDCKDIQSVKGAKDEYFYSDATMAHNYAMIAMLVLEKDLPHTIAHMVRFNCKTYPSPTPLYYFMRSPYSYTKTQLDNALRQIQGNPDTKDIQTVTAFNGVLYMYSDTIMDKRYAQALADDGETMEGD